MTAEVVIINRSGVALAADSAMTIGKKRVWKSTNKLFHLSPSSDVGVMFYGSGDYCGIPWEVLLKEYRKRLNGCRFKTLTDYAQGFVSYLESLKMKDNATSRNTIRAIFIDVINRCRAAVDARKVVDRRQQLLDSTVDALQEICVMNTIFDDVDERSFLLRYSKDIDDLIKDIIDFSVTKKIKKEIARVCYECSVRQFPSDFTTGIVFAGYGQDELLPVLAALIVDGQYLNVPRVWPFKYIDLNDDEASSSYVFSFAQSDMAHMFMEGANADVIDWVSASLKVLLEQKSKQLINLYVPGASRAVEVKIQEQIDKSLTDGFIKQFENFRQKKNTSPMMNVVSSLPKEEMAAMAEALVEITSLRRKMDSQLESVGGPVDVAIVSKADGFVWIKRKHYFDIAINRDFMERRSQRNSGGIGDEAKGD
jgi:hypothetical protein